MRVFTEQHEAVRAQVSCSKQGDLEKKTTIFHIPKLHSLG